MLDEIYEWDESITEDDYYDALYYMLGDVYPRLSDEELEDLIEDILDTMPPQCAESVLDTLGNVGKNIGSGALKVATKNPQLVKFGATAVGGLIGGPIIAAKAGSMAGKYVTNLGQIKQMPETAKTLSLLQNPQVQTSLTRTALGIGQGTGPFTQNGNTQLVATATYLRVIIDSAYKALKELDSNGVIPSAALSEALPYSEDIDMQAEWLAEQLYNS